MDLLDGLAALVHHVEAICHHLRLHLVFVRRHDQLPEHVLHLRQLPLLVRESGPLFLEQRVPSRTGTWSTDRGDLKSEAS